MKLLAPLVGDSEEIFPRVPTKVQVCVRLHFNITKMDTKSHYSSFPKPFFFGFMQLCVCGHFFRGDSTTSILLMKEIWRTL